MAIVHNNTVVGLTVFSNERMCGLLFGPQKSGRNKRVAVLTVWWYGEVPLCHHFTNAVAVSFIPE